MDKKRGFIFLLIIAIVLYFFIFTKKTDVETYLEPIKMISLTNQNISSTKMGGYLVPFLSGAWSGYIDPEEEAVYSTKQNSQMARISSYLQIFKSEDSNWLIEDQQGNFLGSYSSDGVPYLFENRLLDLHQSNGFIQMMSTDGKVLWTTWVDSTITAIDINRDLILVGSMSGRVYLIDTTGNILMNYQPSGSRLEIIYGVALAPDSSGFAVISGLDPQRFIYFKAKENGYRAVYNKNIDSVFRRNVKMSSSFDSSKFLFEGVNSLECFDVNTEFINSYPIANRLNNFFYDHNVGLIIASWKEDGNAGIDIFTLDGDIFFRDSFEQDNFFFDYRERTLYCCINEDILFISLTEEDS